MSNDFSKQVFGSEAAVCQEFWKQVLMYQSYNLMPEFSIFHISNGQHSGTEKQRKRAGGKDKSMGVVRGVADYCVPGHGFLEAKRYRREKNGRIVQTNLNKKLRQPEFKAYVESIGLKHAVFRTPREGIDILQEWGVIKAMPTGYADGLSGNYTVLSRNHIAKEL